jgi:hypothetical protein
MVLSGTLLLGLDEMWQPLKGEIMLVEDAGSHAANTQEAATGIAPVGARDNGRMDTRQNSGQGFDMNRSPVESFVGSLQAGPIGYDSRRDNSRMDSRYDAGQIAPNIPASSTVNVNR